MNKTRILVFSPQEMAPEATDYLLPRQEVVPRGSSAAWKGMTMLSIAGEYHHLYHVNHLLPDDDDALYAGEYSLRELPWASDNKAPA